VATPIFRLIRRSLRLREVIGEPTFAAAAGSGRPVIYVSWHNRLFLCGFFLLERVAWRGTQLTTLVSLSKDGDFGTRLGLNLGFDVVRGSTSRGGLAALRLLRRRIEGGAAVYTVPDGPRGPLYECQEGVVVLSQSTGAPIVPLACAVEPAWRLKSWDRMIVPKPFSSGVVACGEPLVVPREIDAAGRAAQAREIQRRLDAAVAVAEARLAELRR